MKDEMKICSNCAYCWHSHFNGCVCTLGWGENGADVKPDWTCEDWEPDEGERT